MGLPPADSREMLQWFVDNFGLYVGSTRGLFLSDWGDEHEASLEASIISLKSRGLNPFVVDGQTLATQADYLWRESRVHTSFGRPLATKLELSISGCDVLFVDGLEAPENGQQLWYLISYLLYPRAVAGKATVITTPISTEEFHKYGAACQDMDFGGKSINWEKYVWLMDASLMSLQQFRKAREMGLPPMLKAEMLLYEALKAHNLEPVPQQALGDYLLDFTLSERGKKLDIECTTVSAVGGHELQTQEAKRDLVLLSDSWQILKFTSAEIFANAGLCAEVVQEVWKTGRKKVAAGKLLTGKNTVSFPELPVDDEIQRSSITCSGGPTAVIGGSGTGKTTCAAHRVAYLLAQGVNPENILFLSYSRETTRLARKKIEQLLDRATVMRLSVVSWQDFGLRILKENLPLIRRRPPLKIEQNVQKTIQKILAKAKKELDPARLDLIGEVDEFYAAALISMYKAHLISPRQAKEDAVGDAEIVIAKVYQLLEEQLQKTNRVDRDDVITLAVHVLLDSKEARQKYQHQYEFVVVDEAQEMTVAQEMMVRVVAAPQDNLYLTGDDEEVISESKNACPELLTEISMRVPQTRCFALEKNWRCHPEIVERAKAFIDGLSRRRVERPFYSAWGSAPSEAIAGPYILADELAEATWVAEQIDYMIKGGRNPEDIGIVYRKEGYETTIEQCLAAAGTKFVSRHPEGASVPDEAEDVLAFLKLVMDPDGPKAREAFERICQFRMREIDPKLSATIAGFAESNNLSYLKAVEIYSEATADSSCRDLEQLVRIVRTIHQDHLPPAEAISVMKRTQRLEDYYRSVKVPPGVSYEPGKKLERLAEEARQYKTVPEFVRQLQAEKEAGIQEGGGEAVRLINANECKGFEFPVVFMIGLSEPCWPPEQVPDWDEEKRLFYVGFTRAREQLVLSSPGKISGKATQPSRFLKDAGLIDDIEHSRTMAATETVEQELAQAEIDAASQALLEPGGLEALPADEPVLISQPVPHMDGYNVYGVPEEVPAESSAPLAGTEAPEPPATDLTPPVSPVPSSSTQVNAQVTSSESLFTERSKAFLDLQPVDVRKSAPMSKLQPYQQEAVPEDPFLQPPVVSDAADTTAPPAVDYASGEAYGSQSEEFGLYQESVYTEAAYAEPSLDHENSNFYTPEGVFENAQMPAEQELAYQCPTCFAPVDYRARFCGECGQPLSSPAEEVPPVLSYACPVCNFGVEADAKFCGECGTALSAPGSEPGEGKGVWMKKFLRFLEQ